MQVVYLSTRPSSMESLTPHRGIAPLAAVRFAATDKICAALACLLSSSLPLSLRGESLARLIWDRAPTQAAVSASPWEAKIRKCHHVFRAAMVTSHWGG